MIIANDLHVAGQGETSCTILQADGSSRTAEGDKFSVAHAILDAIVERL
jgi:hypothetical protein